MHCDANFVRSKDEQSLLTVNAYMNGSFTGGRTRFFAKRGDDREVAAVQGQSGDCLLFLQPPAAALYHDGEEVASGQKYLFRSDVMYRRVGTEAQPPPPSASSASPGEYGAEAESRDNAAAGRILLHEAECLEAAGRFAEAIAAYTRLKRLHPKVAEEAGVV